MPMKGFRFVSLSLAAEAVQAARLGSSAELCWARGRPVEASLWFATVATGKLALQQGLAAATAIHRGAWQLGCSVAATYGRHG